VYLPLINACEVEKPCQNPSKIGIEGTSPAYESAWSFLTKIVAYLDETISQGGFVHEYMNHRRCRRRLLRVVGLDSVYESLSGCLTSL